MSRARAVTAWLTVAAALAVLLLALTACAPVTPDRPIPSTFGPCTHGTVKLIKGVWKCEK